MANKTVCVCSFDFPIGLAQDRISRSLTVFFSISRDESALFFSYRVRTLDGAVVHVNKSQKVDLAAAHRNHIQC